MDGSDFVVWYLIYSSLQTIPLKLVPRGVLNVLVHIKEDKLHLIFSFNWYVNISRYFSDVPKSKTFDIDLMMTILVNLTDLIPPPHGFDSLPHAIEITPGADLATINYYRNYITHLDNDKLENVYFNTAWDNISGVSYLSETCLQKNESNRTQSNFESITRQIKVT